jgi:rod shape-determining protein MreD
MRRFLLPVVLLLVALVVQLTVFDRLPLPGGVAPDLVLLVVVALALNSGPMTGMICGFCAGLALDIAPPSGHLIGLYALVFCLLGYLCGLVSAELESSVLLPLAASAVGAAAGAALYAAVGIVLGNPDVTGPAVRHVLPLSVLYDVLLSPFVLFGVALAYRLAARLTGAVRPSREPAAARTAAGLGTPALLAGRAPRLRAVATRPQDGWIGGGGWLAASAELARTRPVSVRLNFGGIRTAATPAPAKSASTGNGVARVRFGGSRTAATPARAKSAGGVTRVRFGGSRTAATPARAKSAGGVTRVRFGGSRSAVGPARSSAASTGNATARLRFGVGRRGDAMIGSRLLTGGLVGEFGNGARGLLGPSAGPRLFTRRSRGTGTRWARFSRRPAWGNRGAGATGSAPRRGTFSGSSPQRRPWSKAAPRRGTFSAGSPARGSFGNGSPAKGSFGNGSPSRGAFNGGSPAGGGAFGRPRRMRWLRRMTFGSGAPGRGSAMGRGSALGRGNTMGRGSALGRGNAMGRGGALRRSRRGRSSFWRIGRKRSGGYQ